MNRKKNILLFVFLFFISSISIFARYPVALVIDSSGSMSENDPYDFRKISAKMFCDLADEEFDIGIVDFDEYGYIRTELLKNTKTNKNLLYSGIDLIDSSGGTSISEAILTGQKILQNVKEKKYLILLTDGMGEYYEEAKDFNGTIFTIGLGEDYNKELLLELANSTGGVFYKADNFSDLQPILEDIIWNIRGYSKSLKQVLNFTNNTTQSYNFIIPKTTTHSIIVSSWDKINARCNVKLYDPDGKEIKTNNPNLNLNSKSTYSIFHLKNPKFGKWKIEINPSTNLICSVSAVGDDKIKANFKSLPDVIKKNQKIPIKYSVQDKDGNTLSINKSILSVQLPDKKIIKYTNKQPIIKATQNGEYKISAKLFGKSSKFGEFQKYIFHTMFVPEIDDMEDWNWPYAVFQNLTNSSTILRSSGTVYSNMIILLDNMFNSPFPTLNVDAYPVILDWLMRYFCFQKKYDFGLKIFQFFIKYCPEKIVVNRAHLWRGKCFYHLKEYKKAIKEFSFSIKDFRDESEFWINRCSYKI